MANKLFAEVVIAGSYKNLAKSTRGATKELKGFEKASKKIAGAVQAAFAGIAIAGIGMLADAIVDMTKAAQEDAKSMALLNKQMENSWKATDTTKDAVEDYIGSVSRMTGILDDDLRPAFSKIVRATKNASQATSAFDNVLNIAAGTGKDVNTVSTAYSKYLDGNKTALYRLIPGLKGAKDEAKFLKEEFAGMADLAGENDPFARINVVIEDFKEKLGEAFIPIASDIADWLAGDEAQKAMDDFAKAVKDAFAYLTSPEGKADIQAFIDKFMTLIDSVMKVAEIVQKLLDNGAEVPDGLKAAEERKKSGESKGLLYQAWDWLTGAKPTSPNTKTNVPTSTLPSNTNINPPVVNVYVDPITGKQVTKLLRNTAKVNGIPMSKLLG
jgi:hypothetical protein